MSDKRKSTAERVEEFIQKIRDLDLVIDERASKTMLTRYEIGGTPHQASLSDLLAIMVNNYEETKGTSKHEAFARLCASWIDKAHFIGVIKEGEGLNRKLKACETDKEQIKKDSEQIAERNLELELKCKELEGRLAQLESTQRVFKDLNK